MDSKRSSSDRTPTKPSQNSSKGLDMVDKNLDAGEWDAQETKPLRTRDRPITRPKIFTRSYFYYNPPSKKKHKTKRSTAASRIAKMFCAGSSSPDSAAKMTHLRRSTKKRKSSITLEDCETDNFDSNNDDTDILLESTPYRCARRKPLLHVNQNEKSTASKIHETNYLPRREGLRPRKSTSDAAISDQSCQGSEDDHDTSENQDDKDETENGDEAEEVDGDVGGEEGANEGGGSDEGDERDDDGEEEKEGRRRYDLRKRSKVHKCFPERGEKQQPRLPHKIPQRGMGVKNNIDGRKGGSRVRRRFSSTLDEDSDDFLLVDELVQDPTDPWAHGGNRSGTFGLSGGLDIHGANSWGLNIAASGWSHQSDLLTTANYGIQTAGPSSKGGADIQPLHLDESISFEDIGGLSEYIDQLKEMVFFPLLYPDFFSTYNITPPRGVLLCGPPGTGKTLVARALACAASKAGRKVSFYMRKGADVLSKWVGEAERQLKMLFEEAQKNQPSIIFFDEIDGLAPVRSSKQEQIHNSIVSTLLALMDGLDSRGQVVLIGATNRIDAIDGALRRPGRFDREFNFPLPGFEARTQILSIHTRKWKEHPSEELKQELAASCVGYCGADLKALCTEAAILAFREKYPQVYTSDDKFLIDVDSVNIGKHHFLQAMSTITPAAHRGSIVHSRPLSLDVSPCLQRHLGKVMGLISQLFPSLTSSCVSKLFGFSYGSALSLIYRPRLLLCGDENSGLDHIGPAVLHELEKFPVHSLGLSSLMSDPSAKTPEEALVHIFGEARRTTPSILYLPHFHLWWETAHDLLKAVLITLLEDLPSSFPILLVGTSFVPFSELDEGSHSVFAQRNVYEVEAPTLGDRSAFWGQLIESVLSISSETTNIPTQESDSLANLPKAPKTVSGLKASEQKAKAEAEEHALRRLRMCLRDICNRILHDKRFSAFHYPVTDEDAPAYHTIIQHPMDMATVLQRVDCGQYVTRSSFVLDVHLIVSNAKAYNGDDYKGARIVSRAYELRDAVHGMLSQMDPALVSFCDKIAAQGGPTRIQEELSPGSILLAPPVVQSASAMKTSSRLGHVQQEVNLYQSYEALKRTKKHNDTEHSAPPTITVSEDSPQAAETLATMENAPTEVSEGLAAEENHIVKVSDDLGNKPLKKAHHVSKCNGASNTTANHECEPQKVEEIKQRLVERTLEYGVPQLQRLYAHIVQGVLTAKGCQTQDRSSRVRYLLDFVGEEGNF